MGSKPRPMARASTDQRDGFKTVEVDTSQPYSHLTPNHLKRSSYQHNHHHDHHRATPLTPSPSKTRPIQIRSASPHYNNQSQTPSLSSNYSFNSMLHQHPRGASSTSGRPMPNYMAATESTKARVRSQSTPKQRPSTPERDGRFALAKKRLFFPVLDPHCGNVYNQQNVRSPSFSSVNEHQSNYYSPYYTESIAGGEVSPCSTTDLRRWLK